MMIGSTTYADFDGVLKKLNAKLEAHEVHALYLGALTSTSFRLGPQRLLDQIFGDEPTLGDSIEAANASLQILFGYWNTLLAQHNEGGVHLTPSKPPKPTKEELRAFAKCRQDELEWFVRGIDAGGDDPIEFGPEGNRLLEGIAKGSGFLEGFVELLGRDTPMEPQELKKTRSMMLDVVATIERLISDLMTVSDQVRREALDTFHANAGVVTDDGGHIARPVKIGRNEACPCGSGKKFKKCCGSPSTVQ